ncbi:MAG: leucine-rich repeat domain-containing protein [Clostridia bacterium]|nr:leucine-rich repeat domain-containing protein [Clostridia bacterium]
MKMMKKALFVVLTVAIIACVFTLSAAAETTGTYGKLSYSITDGEVTITACDKTATEVEIPATIEGYPVVSIDTNAFRNTKELTKIIWNAKNIDDFHYEDNIFSSAGTNSEGVEFIFGDTVESIPECIFYNWKYITKVTIGDNVKKIGDGAFGFSSVSEVVIPDSVTTFGSGVFNQCENLTKVILSENTPSIGWGTFRNCSNLKEIIIPDSVISVDAEAFYGCADLSSVTIGNSVKTIGNRAFTGCFSLTEIIIPDSVTSIGYEAFYGCADLSSVTIGNAVETIDYRAFYNCTGLTKINWNAKKVSDFEPDGQIFSECGSANEGISVIFGEGVEYIPEFCFTGNKNIKSVSISNTVKIIGTGAFEDCSGFTSITIPDSVTTIGDMVFKGCSNLTDVTIGNSVSIIDARAFSGCVSLINVTIGKSVETIDEYSFVGCTSLKNINIPDSVNYIANNAFASSGLEKIVINNPKCVIEYNADTIPVDAVIYGHVNSPAQMYAQMYGRDFVPLSAGECEHTYSEWVIDADATCTQRGFAHRVCTLCNGYEFDVIDETGHIDEDADNICDVCDEVLFTQTPDTDDGGESGENNSSDGISSFFASIKELFNRIISWFRTIFGLV